MAGLMGALASGGAQGFARGTEQNSQVAQNMNMQQMNIMVKELMDARIAERAETGEQSRYDRGRKDLTLDRDATHKNRMDEIKAMKDPNDAKLKAMQLKQVIEDSKVPATIKTEYKSLDDSAKVIESAMTKVTAEGMGDPSGLSDLSNKLETIRTRQQELLSSMPDYVKKKGSSLDDLFPEKIKPEQGSSKTSDTDW